ncbi:alpha/beta hydrolase [Streptomyces sp. NPDC005828]|uniref:alpha/beta fold hydrolase n=1 Tax=Streptomyces sp. NPDC005828 TaxID=3157071 RepID=UPI003407F6C0
MPTLVPSTVSARRRTAGAVALLIAAAAATVTPATASESGARATHGTKPTVVLVHGAFADASGWNEVAERLQHQGYDVVAPANPLRGLSNDSTYTASVLKSIAGPIILVGHSYGGAVISSAAAGNPNVKALVYIAAFMPDKGESPAELSTKFPGSDLGTALRPVPYTDNTGSGIDVYIQNDKFHSVFAADLPEEQTRVMAVEQRPITAAGFAEKAQVAAWKTIPSWFLVARQDKAIAPDLERFEAKRAGSRTVEINSSHVAMMSHPGAVTRLIDEAAEATC